MKLFRMSTPYLFKKAPVSHLLLVIASSITVKVPYALSYLLSGIFIAYLISVKVIRKSFLSLIHPE